MIDLDAVANEDVWGSGATSESPLEEEPGPVVVAHVVDFYNRYPGDVVTFFSRVDVNETISDLTLRISLPEGLTLEHYQGPAEFDNLMPVTAVDNEGRYLVWSLAGEHPAGARYEFEAKGRIAPAQWDTYFESRAVVSIEDREERAEDTVSVAIRAKGQYIKHLPALYEQDDLMGRLLMLFESFWAPIESQIDEMYYYFDPRITPASFLPWLAAWLDLELDETWPEARLRQLIRWSIALHRSRGTKWGLLKYLEIYTGQKAGIIERRAKNFVIGPSALLGPAIALGRGNRPHTFTVSLRLPALDIEDEAERARQEKLRQRTIEAIIDMQKPAHTVYTLNLEIASPSDLADEEIEQPARQVEETVDEIEAQAAIWFKLEDEPDPDENKPKRKKRKSSRGKGKKS
jgi:phage tail-like protein